MSNTASKRVAVIGGGLAGLAAATYLGRSGHRVTLFERSETPGGRGGSTTRNGYIHNFGPHALYPNGAAEDVLAGLGVAYSGHRPSLEGVAVRGGKTFTLPTNARSMVATRLFGVRARLEASKQLFALRKPQEDDTRTVAEWLRSEFREPAAREYAQALIRLATYANAPEHTLLRDAGKQFAGAGGGVLYIDGGWQSLVDGLRGVAHASGVSIRTGARVDNVSSHGRTHTIRLAGGEAFEAEAVVLAVPPETASELTGLPALTNFAETSLPARAACLDIGLTRLPNRRRPFGLGIDVPLYFSVHSLSAKLAPEGRVLASVAKYIPAGEHHDAERDLAELEAFLDLVQPGWRAFEEHRQFLPSMVVTTALPRAESGGLAGRPGVAVPGAEGVFVAGDWVGETGWLTDATLGSAREAAAQASEWLAKASAPLAVAVS